MTTGGQHFSDRPSPDRSSPEPSAHADPRRTPRDVLLCRVIDGEATPTDWTLLRQLAAQDMSVWAELSEMQSQREAMERAVGWAGDAADLIALPHAAGGAVREAVRDDVRGTSRPRGGLGLSGLAVGLVGWAAAAAVAVAWFGAGMRAPVAGAGLEQASRPGPVEGAGTLRGMPIDDATSSLLLAAGAQPGPVQVGDVVGEFGARQVLQTRPASDGKLEVIYVRPLVERRLVDEVMTLRRDEFGRPVFTPQRAGEAATIQRASY